MKHWFRSFAQKISNWTGSPYAFASSSLVVILWALSGPTFHYSDTWQLVINTSTTVVTFLMVFLIQNTQNRDSRAIHLKLDELIRANSDARNKLINLEDMSDEELDILHKELCHESEITEEQISVIKEHKEKKHRKHSILHPTKY